MRSAVPTGRVKWYEKEKGYGFLTSDDGGDVYVRKNALPPGVEELRSGQRVEFGVADSRKGAQALSVKLIGPLPSVAEAAREAARTSPDELNVLVEDILKVIEAKVLPDLRRGRYPDKRIGQAVAQGLRKVADQLG
jgi:CspA family cold shock protein